MRGYDAWLQPREGRGHYEVECLSCGQAFESDGWWNEAYGVELKCDECPECGEGNLEVTGDAETGPDPDRQRDERGDR